MLYRRISPRFGVPLDTGTLWMAVTVVCVEPLLTVSPVKFPALMLVELLHTAKAPAVPEPFTPGLLPGPKPPDALLGSLIPVVGAEAIGAEPEFPVACTATE